MQFASHIYISVSFFVMKMYMLGIVVNKLIAVVNEMQP